MSKTKKCAQCGQEKPIDDFSRSYKNLCISCVAKNAMYKRMKGGTFSGTILSESQDVQFIPHPRFTASVAAMQGMLASGKYMTNSADFIARRAVAYADELLNQLNEKEYEMEEHQGTPV